MIEVDLGGEINTRARALTAVLHQVSAAMWNKQQVFYMLSTQLMTPSNSLVTISSTNILQFQESNQLNHKKINKSRPPQK